MNAARTILFLAMLAACAKPPATPDRGAAPTSASAPAPVPAPEARPAGCLEIAADGVNGKPTTVEGTVSSGKHGHPNGSTFTFYALTLDAPRCVTGLEETKSVTEVQIYADDTTPLGPYVGKRVRVEGEPFGEHTAWHVRPVVVHATKIDALR